MKIFLTQEQLSKIKNRLLENEKENEILSEKDKNNEPVNGWDFVSLSNEKQELEYIIKKGFIII